MLPHFFIPREKIEENQATLQGQEAKHLLKVLRLAPGDKLILFDGSGLEYTAFFQRREGHRVILTILDKNLSFRESPLEIILAQGLPKADKMDFIIQKATELGVSRIIPLKCSRSLPRWDRNKSAQKTAHWQQVALEAVKQCGRARIPQVEEVREFDSLLKRAFSGFLKLICWEEEKGLGIKEVLKNRVCQKKVIILVGPEGSFSEEEIERAKKKGFLPIFLGQRVLRTETAALVILSLIQYEWGDLSA